MVYFSQYTVNDRYLTFSKGFTFLNMRSIMVTLPFLFYIGVVGSSFFLVLSAYVDSAEGTIALICTSVAFFGFQFSGFMVNPMDIAPKYAGSIIGISNSIGAIPGFVGPAIAGVMTTNGVSVHTYKLPLKMR